MSTVLHDRPDLPLLAPEADLEDTVRWAVAHAVLAPSLLNSQPWRFRVRVDDRAEVARLEVFLDRGRVLPHLDPAGREAVLSCGAALLNLRLALQGSGLGCSTRLCPDPLLPDLLASLLVHGRVREQPSARALRAAVPERATCRTAFDDRPVDDDVFDQLVADAAYEGSLLAVLDHEQSAAVRAAAAEARTLSSQDPGHGKDLARWSRSNLDLADDGLPGWAHGLGLLASLEELRRLRRGTSDVAAHEAAQESRSAGRLVVLGAPADDVAAVLRAGCGLQRVLLRATTLGLGARFLDEALRYAHTRAKVGRVAQLDHPQCVLHLGYAKTDPATRRRAVDAVLDLSHAQEHRP